MLENHETLLMAKHDWSGHDLPGLADVNSCAVDWKVVNESGNIKICKPLISASKNLLSVHCENPGMGN